MKVLIVANVWPEPKSSAAGSHMMQLIDTFKSVDSIHFACTASSTKNSADLHSKGIQTASIEMNDSSFDVYLSNLSPDIVIFDRFMAEEQFGWRVAEVCPKAIRILNTEDLHSLRKGRHNALKADTEFSDKFLFNDLAKREIASIYRSDLSLIISEVEMNLLHERFNVPSNLLHYTPFMLNAPSKIEQSQLPTFHERKHFMTIGNYLHAPNADVLKYLKETIWPLIRKELNEAELHVYGAYIPDQIHQHTDERDGFIIKGFTEDVDACMRKYRVCLAPLRFGAGLKGKIVDAMQNGTPCMMTSITAEGLFGIGPKNGFICDDPDQFAQRSIELYSQESSWKKCQENGFTTIKNRFNKDKVQSSFIERIEYLKDHLADHRLQNFTGQMLEHHARQSTKYMSKWIEAKNKN